LTKPTIKINWRVYSVPGFIRNICVRGDHIYVNGSGVIGQRLSDAYFYSRIEKRRKADGALVRERVSEKIQFSDCVIADDKLYVFAEQNILVFDLDLNMIRRISRDIPIIEAYLTFYDNFLYAAIRYLRSRVNVGCIVEKWRITDLTMIKRYTSYTAPFGIALNPITKQLWVTGDACGGEYRNFAVEILDLDFNSIRVINKTDVTKASGVDFDEEGCAYVYGYGSGYPIVGYLFKCDKYGNEVTSIIIHGFEPRMLKYINDYVYVIGVEQFRHVLRVFDKNLNQVNKVVLSDSEMGLIDSMFFDGKNLYIGGAIDKNDLPVWIIYSISITSPVTEVISPVDLGIVSSLRFVPLEGLVSGYGNSGSRRFELSFPSGIMPRGFEGMWSCCFLGCGGWGCTYLCDREGERVVFKVPRGFEVAMESGGELPTIHSEILEKIRHEAEIISSLNHSNIIRLLGVSEKAPILIYEYADYGSLYWQLTHGWRPTLRDILLLGIQLGDAIRYIHSRGLMHGDIKPSNVFIKDRVSKLGDFSSMVKLLSVSSFSKMTYTVGFRAPEHVYIEIRRRARELGVENRIDVYQLGNLLLYMLTGESIDGEEAIDDKLILEKLNIVSNDELKSILVETLKPEPEKRPSAEEFIKMLYTIWRKMFKL
jgi:hypothetical protein